MHSDHPRGVLSHLIAQEWIVYKWEKGFLGSRLRILPDIHLNMMQREISEKLSPGSWGSRYLFHARLTARGWPFSTYFPSASYNFRVIFFLGGGRGLRSDYYVNIQKTFSFYYPNISHLLNKLLCSLRSETLNFFWLSGLAGFKF